MTTVKVVSTDASAPAPTPTFTPPPIIGVPSFSNPPMLVPGLEFPVKMDALHCTGPEGACGPSTANISSIFDHQMSNAYESNRTLNCYTFQSAIPTYGKIMDFQGEELDGPAVGGTAMISTDAYGKNNNLCGYSSGSSSTFLAGYNLQQPTFLYYDGHPGYDYPFGFGTALFPATSGCATYTAAAAGAPPQKYHALTIVPKFTKPTSCKGVTSDTGYTVAYLHLSSFVTADGSIQRCFASDGTSCVACPECVKEGEWVDVSRTTPIAYVGNFSGNAWRGVSPHLHFETDEWIGGSLWNGGTPMPIDPYGWQPKLAGQKDKYTELHRAILNRILWNP